jgi:hypothetical protein
LSRQERTKRTIRLTVAALLAVPGSAWANLCIPGRLEGTGTCFEITHSDGDGFVDGPDFFTGGQCDSAVDQDCALIEPSASALGSVTGHHTYAVPGVYSVRLTVAEQQGDSGESIFQFVVVYAPSGGWIMSPPGACQYEACADDPTGTANSGFG